MIKRDMVQADVYVQVTVLNEYNEKPKDFVFTKKIKWQFILPKKKKQMMLGILMKNILGYR